MHTEAIARRGCVALVKIDGIRSESIFTVMISGGALGDAYFREDGDDLATLLRSAIAFFQAHDSDEVAAD